MFKLVNSQRFSRARRIMVVTLALLGIALVAPAGPSGPVAWGTTVNVAGGGWGRMIQLTNGHWLCVSTMFPGGTNTYLAIYRSTDTCRTWSFLSQVNEAGRNLDNGELIALPNGNLLLSMRSLIDGVSYRLPVYRSTNNGQAWSYLSNIDASEGAGTRGLWEPDFWVLDDGRLIVTYSNERHQTDNPSYSQIISEKVSLNNGASWDSELWAVAQPGGGSLRPGMSQMARMANGKYILVYEVVGSGNADVHFKISNDGVTWPSGLGTRIPCQHCGPFVMALPDGRVFVTSCENEVSFSEDFGETWQKIDPPAWNLGFAFSWPAIYATRTNELAVMAVAPSLKLRFGALSPPFVWPNPFTNDFNSGTDVNWTRYGGNFAFNSGRYLLNNTNTYGKALVGDNFWTDGTLEADVLISTATGDAGLLFRATNPDYTGPDDVFGYYAGLRSSGSVFLGKMSYSWNELTSAPVTVGTNTWHHLKITMQSTALKIYVDDMATPKIIRDDSTHGRGQIGVRTFQSNAQFDNVTFSNAASLRLNLQRAGNLLQFAWQQNAYNLQLTQTTNLFPPPNWLPVTNTATLSNGQWNLALPQPPATWQFYRLQPK
jgi:hypothetical protein